MAVQPLDILCTAEEFRSLVCPYTGRPLQVYMLIVPGQRPMFHAPEAYAPAIPYESKETSYRMWNRKNGVEGLKSDTPIVCAYTGEPLRPMSDPHGFWYSGGFDPRRFYPREDFLRLASSRNGVSPREVEEPTRIEASAPDMKPVFPHRIDKPELSDEAIHIAEKAVATVKDILPTQASTTVSMSVSSKRVRSKRNS